MPLFRSARPRPSVPAGPEPGGPHHGRDGTGRSAAPRAAILTVADYCLATLAGLSVVFVTNVPYQLRQPYWLDEAWVADSVRAPLSQVPRLASSTPLGWTLLLRLVPFGGPERQRLVPLAFYAFAYYYPTPPGSYPASTGSANGFFPAYPNAPWIIALTNRDQRTITDAVEHAIDMIAAEPPRHRGRIWVIRDHAGRREAAFWRYALADGTATTITFGRQGKHPPEPLVLYRPAIHAGTPAPQRGASGGQWQRMLSLSTTWPASR
ncbi:MAG: hypothetical protein JWM19_1166 [Actinomycetia bacterium]|nr:hypothetical protein [Actinomycetes bacterium]